MGDSSRGLRSSGGAERAYSRILSRMAEDTRKGTGQALIESFILIDPLWVLLSGTIPFWTVFSTELSYFRALEYVIRHEPFEEILTMPFPHGVKSAGLASANDWETLTGLARNNSRLVGVDKRAYPRDFAALIRYSRVLWKAMENKDRAAPSLPLDSLLSFLETRINGQHAQQKIDTAATSQSQKESG